MSPSSRRVLRNTWISTRTRTARTSLFRSIGGSWKSAIPISPRTRPFAAALWDHWWDQMLEEGYPLRSVNGILSTSNTYLEFIGHRELQAVEKVKLPNTPSRSWPERSTSGSSSLPSRGICLASFSPQHRWTCRNCPRWRQKWSARGIFYLFQWNEDDSTLSQVFAGGIYKLCPLGWVARRAVACDERGQDPQLDLCEYHCPPALPDNPGPRKEGQPQCLRWLYQDMLNTIEDNAVLVEQVMDR